jgi:hypothetical protein
MFWPPDATRDGHFGHGKASRIALPTKDSAAKCRVSGRDGRCWSAGLLAVFYLICACKLASQEDDTHGAREQLTNFEEP